MKKLIASAMLLGSTVAISACDTTTMGDVDTAPPYALERTATHDSGYVAPVVVADPAPAAVAPAERVFQRAQTK